MASKNATPERKNATWHFIVPLECNKVWKVPLNNASIIQIPYRAKKCRENASTITKCQVWPIQRFKIPKRRRSSQDPKTSDPFFMLYTVHAKYWFLSLFCMRVHHIVDDADLIAYQMWNEFTCFTSVGIKLCVNWGIHYEILWLHCMSSNLIAYDAMCTYCVDVRWSTHPLKQMRCVSYLYVICGRNNNECWRSWLK